MEWRKEISYHVCVCVCLCCSKIGCVKKIFSEPPPLIPSPNKVFSKIA